jgi:hypothetical protein
VNVLYGLLAYLLAVVLIVRFVAVNPREDDELIEEEKNA